MVEPPAPFKALEVIELTDAAARHFTVANWCSTPSSKDAARHQASNLGWRTEPEQCPACRTRKRKAS